MSKDLSSRLEFRVQKELKEAFLHICERQDRDGAQMLREFMRDYVKKNSQIDLFSPAKKRSGSPTK